MGKFTRIVITGDDDVRYIRFERDGVRYAAKWLSFSVVENIADDGDLKQLRLEKKAAELNARYWYMKEDDLDGDEPPDRLTLYSDDYSIEITTTRSITGWYSTFREALNLTVEAFDRVSTNPFGRYDNASDGPKRILVVPKKSLPTYKAFFEDPNTSRKIHHPLEIRDTAPTGFDLVGITKAFSVYVPKKAFPVIAQPDVSLAFGVHGARFNDTFIQAAAKRTLNARITADQVQAWMGQKRNPQQSTVMNGHSAGEVAADLKLPDVEYEWLHLIAHSFGPAQSLATPQHRNNLVLGTSASNSQMLEHESKIQLYALFAEFTVDLTVTVNCVKLGKKQFATWLATDIIYDYRVLDTSKKPNKVIFTEKVTFNPFLGAAPSLAEFLAAREFLGPPVKKQKTGGVKTNTFFVMPGVPVVPSEPLTAASVKALLPDRYLPLGLKLAAIDLKPAEEHAGPLLGGMKSPAPKLLRNLSTGLDENPGFTFTAIGSSLGKPDIPVRGAVLKDGQPVATTMTIAKNGFAFTDLFQSLAIEHVDLFILDDVNLHLVAGSEGAPNQLLLDGVLRMDSGPLAAFKSLLGLEQGIFISGQLDFQGTSLDEKLEMQELTLASAATFRASLPGGLTLVSGALQMSIGPSLDNVALTEGWYISAFIGATVEIGALGGEQPAIMDASLAYQDGSVYLHAEALGIADVFGIPGFTLDTLAVQGSVGSVNNLQITARLSTGVQHYSFLGELSESRAGIIASAENFTLHDVADLFFLLSGEQLALPDYDMTFDQVFVGLATSEGTIAGQSLSKGLTVRCDLTVHGHRVGAEAILSTDGVSFSGTLGDLDIGPLSIKEARLSLDLYRASSGKPTDFAIRGAVVIEGVEVDGEVRYEKQSNGWGAVVYARLGTDGFRLSEVIPAVKGTFADSLAFDDAVFIYASQDGAVQSPAFAYPVRKGVQLMGRLQEVSALSTLTRSAQSGLIFSAHFGTTTDIGIDVNDMKLDLGRGVTTDPFRIRIVLTPVPAFQLIFGMNVAMPSQEQPLHFDLMLEVGAAEARGSATMKNWWEAPFGINGLKIGPAVALQLGIIYAQFTSTGLPSEFGLAGGLAIGDVEAQMAVNISEDPTREILMGSLTSLTPQDLVRFANLLTGLSLPPEAVPNFLEFRDLLLYIAPSGGTIGTLTFEQGFSFGGKMILFGKMASIFTRVAKDGVVAKGSLDHLALGPLEIRGHQGPDARFDLELTAARQSLLIDGAIVFFGVDAELFVDLSNKGLHFYFELGFLDVMKFVVQGDSEGSLSQPDQLDFRLYALFQSDLTLYLKTTVVQKLRQAMDIVEHDIDVVKQRVDAAEQAYLQLFTPAEARLREAQQAADRYLRQLQDQVAEEKRRFDDALNEAQRNVEAARSAYDGALQQAQNAVEQAQRDYDSAMRQAQDAITQAQADYDQVMNSAQQALNDAERAYNNAMNDAIGKVQNARNSVGSLQREIDDAVHQLKHLHWYEYTYKGPALSAKIAGLEAAMQTATGVLYAAEGFLNGLKYGGQYTALESARQTLEAVRYGGKYAALETAKQMLEGVRIGGRYTALESAKQTLAAVRTGTEYTLWQTALQALHAVQQTGRAALTEAEAALSGIGQSAVYLALEAAKQSLELIKTGTAAAAFESAKIALEAARHGAEGMLALAAYAAEHAGDLFDLKRVELSGSLQEVKQGKLLTTSIEAAVLGHDYRLQLDFDVRDAGKLIEDMFKHALDEAVRLAKG